MKKRWKIFWGTCIVTGVIGICFLVIAIGMGVTLERIENELPNGISIGKFETESGSEEAVEVNGRDGRHTYDGIRGLDIDLTAGELQILVSDDQHISMQTEGISRKLKLRHYREGDELVLTSEKSILGSVNQGVGIIYIYLPEDYGLEEAEINVHAGTLYIEDIHADELSVDVGAGEATIYDFWAREADLDCGAGEIMAFGIVDKNMDIDCGIGSVNFSTFDKEENYNYNLSCGVGEIECGSNRYCGIGSDQKVNNSAPKNMDIDCGIGEVYVEFEEHHEETHEEMQGENHF